MNLWTPWSLLKEAASDWADDKAGRLAAALAFYSVLSLAPLLLIVVAIAGAVFGDEAARGEIVAQMRGLIGRDGAEVIQTMLENAREPKAGMLATIVGLATLLFAASGVFAQLQGALNTIWEVEPVRGRGVRGLIRDRFLSFTMVLGTGFLLLVSLVISAGLAAAGKRFGDGAALVWQAVNFVVSFGVVMLLFAMIYKVLPDVRIAWKDVWIGAILTAALFTLGKFLIGFYMGHSSVGSPFGAAGSLVALVIWIYYSCQIVFFGAELTQVYANRFGSRIDSRRGEEGTIRDGAAGAEVRGRPG
jgi:membrane protein